MSIKFLVLGGEGYFGFWGAGADFIFLGARIFLSFVKIHHDLFCRAGSDKQPNLERVLPVAGRESDFPRASGNSLHFECPPNFLGQFPSPDLPRSNRTSPEVNPSLTKSATVRQWLNRAH